MNRRRIILIILLLNCSLFSAVAQYSWFIDFKGRDFSGAEDLSIDPQDNVLVVGNFSNGVDIAGTSYSGRGSFLLKLSKKGSPQWHTLLRYGSGNFWGVNQVATDAQGNAYIAGTFTSSVTIGAISLSNTTPYNVMIAKISPAGATIWTKMIPNVIEFYDMKVNDAGNILFYTEHTGTVTIDNTTIDVGLRKSFGFLLSPQGELIWARALGVPQKFTTWPKACALDNSNNAYLHGVYNDTLSLDGKRVVSSGGTFDYFFAKFNAQGTCQWITAAERKAPAIYENSLPGSPGVIQRGALEVDAQGNVYGGGTFWKSMTIGGTTLTSTLAGDTDDNIFLLKLNPTGQPEWATSPPGLANNTVDDLVIRNRRIYFAGLHVPQFYLSQYSQSGHAIGPEELIPISGNAGSGLGVDSKDSVYMSGSMFASPLLNGFVFRYNYNPTPPPIITKPVAICSSYDTLTIKTSPLAYAQSYEWEVTHGDDSVFFTTNIPELKITLSALGIDGDFSIRVRGVYEFAQGQYSLQHAIRMDNPLEKPNLIGTCKNIYLEIAGPQLLWYNNEEQLQQYDSVQTNIKPDSAGSYHVTISNACGTVASNLISYSPVSTGSLFIPNVITPNQDGLNEFFVVDTKLESPSLVIYNRWGSQVFYSSTYSNQWNGDNLPTGVYYYKISSDCLTDPIRGTITILK